MKILQCVYPFVTDGHLGSFKFRSVMNRAAVSMFVHAFCVYVHVSDGCESRSEKVASMYVQFQELLTVFQSGCTNLYH